MIWEVIWDGRETKEAIEKRYSISNLKTLITSHIQSCLVCSQSKGTDIRIKKAFWPYDDVLHFGETVHIDLLKLPNQSPNGNK